MYSCIVVCIVLHSDAHECALFRSFARVLHSIAIVCRNRIVVPVKFSTGCKYCIVLLP